MKTLSSEKNFSFLEFLYKCVIFAVTLSVIVYFLPREGKFNYQFDINKPWKYGLLQASFDFPIYKPDTEMQKEQDSIMKRYVPYFQLDKSVGESMIAKFRKDYAENLKTIIPHPAYERHIENALKNIYSAGVIASTDLSLLDRDSVAKIQVIDRNMSKQEAVSDVFTFKQAYEKLIGADTVRYRKSLLQKCNLNDYITPNLTYDAERSETAKQELFRELSWANGFVMNGQKIIDRGEIVDENTYNILKSLEKEGDKRSETGTEKRRTMLGQLRFVAILVG